MLQCSMGALLLLLPWFGGLVQGEISKDFSQCLDFFYKKTPPTGIPAEGYQPICQRFQNQYRFATLYHRQHRSPLYSAYILSGTGNRPDQAWMFEPQLADSRASSKMQNFSKSTLVHQNVKESQAVDEDYKNSGFTRGHLNPSLHHETEQDRRATFTLTNIVPQHKSSNNGPWNVLEQEVLKSFKDFCTGTMYVITGVMPFKYIPRWINNRVSVPKYMWSAYCCPSFKVKLPRKKKAFFPTYAAVGRNGCCGRGYEVKRMSLKRLEKILSQRLGGTINLFDGRCK
ncbi:uncharacterized protein ACO6RY_15379 [Pungitius sinensis]